MATPDPGDLGALEKAVNDAAGKASALWLTFISFATLLIITVGSVTHRHLFLEKDLKLPVLNVELPLLGFFFAAPLFFLVFHFYVFLQLHGLAIRVAAYNKGLQENISSADERWLLRQRLDPFVFVQMLAGARERRVGGIGWSNRLVAWITVVGLPLATLLLIQLTFLPYHHEYTWLHRGAVLADLTLAWIFWRKLTIGMPQTEPVAHLLERAALKILGRHAVAWLERQVWFARGNAVINSVKSSRPTWLPRLSTLVAVALSFLVATFSMISTYPTENIYPWTETLTDSVFKGTINVVNGRPNTWFGLSNVLVLPDQDFGVAEKLKALIDAKEPDRTTLSFRGRDLTGAVLDRVDLRQADFTGAKLSGAQLSRAKLTKARFECGDTGQRSDLWFQCTELQGAMLRSAELGGATLDSSQLQGASLASARLQGASLDRAQLQGAQLNSARLQGASLRGAQLQGASLENSQLQGASLAGFRVRGEERWHFATQLQGASLKGAQLQGALLGGAALRGATLVGARLQGASLDGVQLQGAMLDGAFVYRTACREGVRLPHCAALMREIGKACHRQLVVRPPYGTKRTLDGHEATIAAQLRHREFVEKIVSELPTDNAKRLVRARLRVFSPIGYSSAKDTMDARAWKELERSTISLEEHKKERGGVLRELACKPDNAPHVARGLIRNYRAFQVRSSKSLHLPSENACPGAKGLTSDELQRLATWFEDLDHEIVDARAAPHTGRAIVEGSIALQP